MTSRKFLVLMAVGCLLAASAFAQAPSIAAGASGTADFAEPDGGAMVLYDQIDNASGNGAPDQDFEAAYDVYDSEAADDFDVDWPDGWDVSAVNTVGTTGGAAATVDVTFYADNGGTPLGGAEVCAYTDLTDFTDTAGSLSINLDPVCSLPTGLHWVAIQTQQDFATAGQHFWSNRTVDNNAPGHWRNPGDGFGNGCTDWSVAGATCGVGGGFNDFQFQIVGTLGTPPPPDDPTIEVPTLGQFGLAALILGLLGAGVARLRRRS